MIGSQTRKEKTIRWYDYRILSTTMKLWTLPNNLYWDTGWRAHRKNEASFTKKETNKKLHECIIDELTIDVHNYLHCRTVFFFTFRRVLSTTGNNEKNSISLTRYGLNCDVILFFFFLYYRLFVNNYIIVNDMKKNSERNR